MLTYIKKYNNFKERGAITPKSNNGARHENKSKNFRFFISHG